MMKVKIGQLVLGMFLLLVIVLPAFTGQAVANDGDEGDNDGDGVDDGYEEVNEREVGIEEGDYGASIQSELKHGENKDKFEIKIQLEDDGIKAELEYKTESDSLESELKFKVGISRLIEYNDTNGDGIYNASTDQIVQEVPLNDFQPIVFTNMTSGNATVHVLTVTTTDGVFTFRMYITGEFADINSSLISPAEVKIDIEIHGFNYLNDSSDLALQVKLKSSSEYEVDEEIEDEENDLATDETSLVTGTDANNFTGFFSWVETALIDGVNKTVKNSPLGADEDDENDHQDGAYVVKSKFYLNYPRGQDIIHDPKIGVTGVFAAVSAVPFGTGTSPSSNGLVNAIPGFILTASAVLVISGVTVLVIRKKRGK
ncbi:MAG: hypothetical protein ACFFD4_17975 [Candidatus Odinarchaeota archaeon]